MAEIVYNNAKNASFSLMPFEFNYGYYPWMLYKNDVNSYSKSKLADKLLAE